MMRATPLGTYTKGTKAKADYLLEKSVPVQADYYLNGADGKSGEPCGRWLGAGAEELELTDGVVMPNQLHGIMKGYDPREYDPSKKDNEGLVQRPGPHLVAGVDCTISFPKELSMAVALETPERRALILKITNEAINQAVSEIEKGVVCRRGHNGRETEPVAGLFVSVFEHMTSRVPKFNISKGVERVSKAMGDVPDMHLHYHVLVSGTCLRQDGSYGAMDNMSLFDIQKKIGAMVRANVCSRLRDELGYEIIPGKGDTFGIAGFSDEMVRHFSKRQAVIQEWMKLHKDELDAKGLTGKAAEEYALTKTRKTKDSVNRPALFAEWQEEAKREFGIDAKWMERLRRKQKTPEKLDLQKLIDKAANGESAFPLRKLETALYQEAQTRDLDVPQMLDDLLKGDDLVLMKNAKDGEMFVARRELFEMERYIGNLVVERRHDARHRTDADKTAAIADGFAQASREKLAKKGITFNEKIWVNQRKAVVDLTTKTGQFAVLKGYAGAGKTTVMTCVRQVYESEGYQMLGCALAGKAAENLQKEAGIKSDTLAGLLAKIEHGSVKLHAKNVVVVDEAGMVDSKLMHGLVKACTESGAKLITLGEAEQLQPVGAGGVFRMMEKLLAEKAADSAGVQVLDDITRQKDKRLTDAILAIRRGDGAEGLRIMEQDLGCVRRVADRTAAMEMMVKDWFEAKYPDSHEKKAGKGVEYQEKLMIAGTRAEIKELNGIARGLRRKAGELTGKDIELDVRPGDGAARQTRSFAVGDRIAFFKKDGKLGEPPFKKMTKQEFRGMDDRNWSKLNSAQKQSWMKQRKAFFDQKRQEDKERIKGVQNGAFAEIVKIKKSLFGKSAVITARMDDGREITFDTGTKIEFVPAKFRSNPLAMLKITKYDAIDHAYAVTGHKSQGQTVEKAFFLPSPSMASREWTYVGASRTRGETRLYVPEEQYKGLAKQISRSRMKGTTLDYDVVDKSGLQQGNIDLDELISKTTAGRYDKKIETIGQAIAWGNGDDIRRLIAENPKTLDAIRAVDEKGNTLLHLACYKKNADAVAALIEAGATVDVANHLGITPLMDAVRSKDADAVALLVQHGADPLRASKAGDTPIRFASDIERKSGEIVEKAKAEEAVLRHQVGQTATESEKNEILGRLASLESIRTNADKERSASASMVAVFGRDKQISLEKAIEFRSNPVIREILADPQRREQVSQPTANGKTPLHLAAAKGNAWAVKELLAAGADSKAVDGYGSSALMSAVRAKNPEIVKMLVAAGSDPTAKDGKGRDTVRIARAVVRQTMEEVQSKPGETKSLLRAKETLEAVDPEFREYLARVEKQREDAAKVQQQPKPERKPVLVPKKKEQMPTPAPAKRKDDHEMEM